MNSLNFNGLDLADAIDATITSLREALAYQSSAESSTDFVLDKSSSVETVNAYVKSFFPSGKLDDSNIRYVANLLCLRLGFKRVMALDYVCRCFGYVGFNDYLNNSFKE